MSSVKFFTNQVGNLQKVTVGELHSKGQFFGRPPYDNVSLYQYTSAISRKPPPHPGDGHHAYNYNRSGGNVELNEPYATRHFDRHTEDDGTVTTNWDYTTQQSLTNEYITFSFNPFSPEDGNAEAQANVKALNNLSVESTQGGADLGEAKTTFDMFCGTARDLASLILQIKRRQWHLIPAQLRHTFPFRRGRGPADWWLEYQYGWKPLMSSLYDTAAVLQQNLEKGNYTKAVGTAGWSDSLDFKSGTNRFKATMSGSHRTVYIAQIVVPGLVRANNLGLINPLSIAWELMPFSFMIDWFVPVGQVMSALTGPLGFQPVGGWTSSRSSYELNIHRENTDFDPNNSEEVAPGAYREVGASFQRTAHASFKMPDWFAVSNPFRTTRALNAIAIARQLT